jgi:ParB-like chromosome segregation protein Spo0J
MANTEWIAIEAVSPNRRNARVHSRKQTQRIANSIAAFGFLTPILIDEDGT